MLCDRTGTPCSHERGHIGDSLFHGDGYATAASRRIFCDVCRMQRWLDVEAALALSQADVGLIPRAAAAEIVRAANLERVDLDRLRKRIQRNGHSLVSLLEEVQEACPGTAAQFLHHGATTQDVQDTAQAMEMGEVLDEVEAELGALVRRLVDVARHHRDTLMVGRTQAQPALPTTFGLKVASWLDEVLRDAERVAVLRSRVLVAQLFGGVGTMAGFAGKGPSLLERFAARLALGVPVVSWHVARDRVAEYLATLAMLTATLARVADEVRVLSRPELGELEQGWEPGRIASSTMPHKRNPEGCAQVVVLARLSRAAATVGLEGMIHEHERDSRALRLEWATVADASHHTLAALAILRPVLLQLKVHDDRMAKNARQAADAICSEALMLALGRHLGKQRAYDLVYEVSQGARDQGASLREALAGRPDVTAWLGPQERDEIFEPARHLGSAGVLVDRAVAAGERWLADREQRERARAVPGSTADPGCQG